MQTAISSYFQELSNMSKLSAQQEYELAVKAKEGDIDARNKVIEANLRFAVSAAKKFQTKQVDFEDLISAANEGLIRAFDRYDPTVGVKFITYASRWIKAAIMEELNEDRTIRTPVGRDNLFTCQIDAPIGDDEDMTLVDTLAYDDQSVDTVVEAEDFRKHVLEFLEPFSQKTKDVMDGYFQIYNEFATTRDVEEKYSMTSEGVRRIKNIVLTRMREELNY